MNKNYLNCLDLSDNELGLYSFDKKELLNRLNFRFSQNIKIYGIYFNKHKYNIHNCMKWLRQNNFKLKSYEHDNILFDKNYFSTYFYNEDYLKNIGYKNFMYVKISDSDIFIEIRSLYNKYYLFNNQLNK
jgi:hypothetical protein